MSKSEERNMVKVATLYYKEGLTQAQIAKKMGVSRSLISKWLIDARKAG
ncbi:sugar-binding transcriptional regulator, partial [Staphylococcus warneri]